MAVTKARRLLNQQPARDCNALELHCAPSLPSRCRPSGEQLGWEMDKAAPARRGGRSGLSKGVTSVLGTSPASTRSTFMTNDDTIATAGSAEQRIDSATDAIRGMSHDLAKEVAPPLTWLDRVSAAAREAPIQSLAIAFLIGILLARR